MRNFFLRKVRTVDVEGLFANTETGLLQDMTFRVPVENRFTPDSNRKVENALKNYFKEKDLPFVTVKIRKAECKTVVCLCSVIRFLDASQIINEYK